ncbi:MAG: hypothetical protein IIA14_06595, partial [SAR324 cluster bacterium]|nr:hypothetical protein [SAR324 cluster bacterium]
MESYRPGAGYPLARAFPVQDSHPNLFRDHTMTEEAMYSSYSDEALARLPTVFRDGLFSG